jgi:hypothetical protein
MSEFREYVQEYIEVLQTLLKEYQNDDLMVGKAQEIFKNPQDPRYLVLSQRLAQLKKLKEATTSAKNGEVPMFKFVDERTY